MNATRRLGFTLALTALALTTAACRVQVDKGQNGEDKNVKIETPLGGIHVNSDAVSAADIGLDVYPGARVSSGKGKDKSADIHMGFGDWQLRVKVVKYQTSDSQDKVIAYYQKQLGRFGDVIECRGNASIGTTMRTREGLTCEDSGHTKFQNDDSMHDDSTTLKAGSRKHQHIMAIDKSDDSGTTFALVQLDLPTDNTGKPKESD